MHRRRFVMGAVAASFGNSSVQALHKLTPGMIAPPFSRTGFDGKTVELAAFKDKVVLLDFWGTWCPPCVTAVPTLRDLQRKHAKEAFVILSVSSDSDETVVRTFTLDSATVPTQRT